MGTRREKSLRGGLVLLALAGLLALIGACASGGAATVAQSPQQPSAAAQPAPAAPAADPVAPQPAVHPQAKVISSDAYDPSAAEMQPQRGGVLVGPSKRMPSCQQIQQPNSSIVSSI